MGLVASVIGRTVDQQDGILAEVRPLQLNFFKEPLQKQTQDIAVSNGHGQSHVDGPLRVYGG